MGVWLDAFRSGSPGMPEWLCAETVWIAVFRAI